MRVLVMLGLIAAVPAAAQETCVVPPELKGFASPMAGRTNAALTPGKAVRVTLARDAKLPIAPDKMPAAGTHGGTFGFTVTRAGRYRVALDGPVWVEVASDTHKLGSVAHGHAPACSGARKLVDYDLAAGRYLVQLSGAKAPAATLMIVRL